MVVVFKVDGAAALLDCSLSPSQRKAVMETRGADQFSVMRNNADQALLLDPDTICVSDGSTCFRRAGGEANLPGDDERNAIARKMLAPIKEHVCEW